MSRRWAVLAAAAVAGCGGDHAAQSRPEVFRIAVGSGLRPDEVATGFVLGPGRIVTVAHVLGDRRRGASLRRPRGATILSVDQRDDLALLAAPGLHGPRVRLGEASGDVIVLVVRDGGVRALRAHVRRSIMARIRTPDGRRVVRRAAFELRADIGPGDSGAPVVTSDGRVGGVVFARSNVRAHTAYAVAARAIASAATCRSLVNASRCR